MYEHFAKKIEKCCPDAWVINYTNPMAVCVRTLYRVFPSIKAYGCCHEVFHTQDLLAEVIERDKSQIYTNVIGVNHFTFITQATCDGYDILPAYKRFVEKNYISGYQRKGNEPFPESYFGSLNKVKFDLFRRFGIIAPFFLVFSRIRRAVRHRGRRPKSAPRGSPLAVGRTGAGARNPSGRLPSHSEGRSVRPSAGAPPQADRKR